MQKSQHQLIKQYANKHTAQITHRQEALSSSSEGLLFQSPSVLLIFYF